MALPDERDAVVLAVLIAFAYSRRLDVAAFARASSQTSLVYGAVNTAVLVTSSLTISLALRAAPIGDRRLTARLLVATATLGLAFLAIKGLSIATISTGGCSGEASHSERTPRRSFSPSTGS